jgi:hypothetical protein
MHMPALQAADYADLVTTGLRDLGRMKFTNIASRLVNYVGFKELFRKERTDFRDGGYEIQWNILNDHSNAARHIGLYAVDDVNVVDAHVTATHPWRHTTTNWAFDEHEVQMNGGAARILDLIKNKRIMSMIALAEKIETAIWSGPALTDTPTPHGIPHWVVYNATTGHNGGAPTGHTTVGGLNPTTYTRWKNFTAQYTAISKTDLVTKMREAAVKTNFKSPVEYPSYGSGRANGYYTTYAVIAGLETLLEAQNDNLGNKIDSMDGETTFRRSPMVHVSKLDSGSATGATADPVWMLQWNEMAVAIMRGWFMKEKGPFMSAKQHNVVEVHVDLSWNTLCYNRRAQALISKSDPLL